MEVTGGRNGTCGLNVNDKYDGQTILTLVDYVTRNPNVCVSQPKNSDKKFTNNLSCLTEILFLFFVSFNEIK